MIFDISLHSTANAAEIDFKGADDLDWQIADRELRQFAKSRARSDFEEAGLLLAVHRARVHGSSGSAISSNISTASSDMARAVLGGPRDDARSSYQVAISVCPGCNRSVQEGRGRSIPIDEDLMEMIDCDAQYVTVDPHGHEERATQTVPPAKRRHVIRRDHNRCAVPGCTSAIFLDLHHTELVSEGGAHDPDAMITVCGAHHRAVHKGRLLITGRCSSGFVFRHADGSSYGAQLSVNDAKIFADAFSALKWLGFKEGESRAALDGLRTHVGMTTERVIREALAVLRVPHGSVNECSG